MQKKIHTYENDKITITYDANRCIHAAECVKGLRKVFDPDKRPWIQPDAEGADRVAEIVERCPTGALHYERKDDDAPGEAVPPANTISVTPDGPVYLRGNIEVQDHEGNVLLTDTRFALCRCGKSGNKPACDNTHSKVNFEAPAFISSREVIQDGIEESDKLVLKVMQKGPVLVEGSYTIYSPVSPPKQSSKNIALCRCGGSGNKPFCDGTHKKIGFEG